LLFHFFLFLVLQYIFPLRLIYFPNVAGIGQPKPIPRSAYPVALVGNGINIMRLVSYHIDDCPPCRVGYCLVNISSGYHIMQVSACKYISKHLLAQIYL
jgi:hypothetical protein